MQKKKKKKTGKKNIETNNATTNAYVLNQHLINKNRLLANFQRAIKHYCKWNSSYFIIRKKHLHLEEVYLPPHNTILRSYAFPLH